MAKFYRQELGVLIPPDGFDKWHVAWSVDNIIEGFKLFQKENGHWPMSHEIDRCPYLPNINTIQRNFGGIIEIRKHLGLTEIDFRTGSYRSNVSKNVGLRGFVTEEKLRTTLVKLFLEPFVHTQSRVLVRGININVDFVVYHKSGKFAVDVFYPDIEKIRFTNNIVQKYRTYKYFPYLIYLCVANEGISQDDLLRNTQTAKISRNPNAKLITQHDFLEEVGKYDPLPDPYHIRVGK